MRATERRCIRIRSGWREIRVETRALETRAAAGGLREVSGHVEPSKRPAPVCDRPIAFEVSRVLAARPLRFPCEWF
jgi:hypothetical protein